MRSLFLISTWIAFAMVACASDAKRGEPAIPSAPPAVALTFVEHRVMEKATGLPTDTAATIDEYVAHLRTIRRRPDVAGADGGAYDSAEDRTNPRISVGRDVVTADLENENTLVVRRAGKTVYRRVLPDARQRFQVDQLSAWKGHWILEYDGDVVIDGESLRARGYDEVFDWMIVGGEPLFFFTKNGRVGISHRGRELAVAYDHVLHGGCCELGAFNPRETSWGVGFHARRSATWFYVEASASE